MIPRVTAVEPLEDFRLRLTFSNGVRVEVDFRDRIVGRGGVFAPLQDPAFFRRVQVDPEVGTLVWPNGVDLDPDVLYSQATGEPLPRLEPASRE